MTQWEAANTQSLTLILDFLEAAYCTATVAHHQSLLRRNNIEERKVFSGFMYSIAFDDQTIIVSELILPFSLSFLFSFD